MAEHLALIVSLPRQPDLLQWLQPDYQCLFSRPDEELDINERVALMMIDARSVSEADLLSICRQLRQASDSTPLVVWRQKKPYRCA